MEMPELHRIRLARESRSIPGRDCGWLSRTLCLALAAAALWLAGCGGDDDPVAPPTPVPTEVVVSPDEARLGALGATVQLSATVRDQNGQVMSGVAVTWASGDPAVATVSAAGLVTAVSHGSVRVTATAGTASGSADVAVEQVVAEVGCRDWTPSRRSPA